MGSDSTTGPRDPELQPEGELEWRPHELRPWARWFGNSLILAFIAYSLYYGWFVFPTGAIVTEPILSDIFFGLLVATGFWLILLRIGETIEDVEEREYIHRELRRLREAREPDGPGGTGG